MQACLHFEKCSSYCILHSRIYAGAKLYVKLNAQRQKKQVYIWLQDAGCQKCMHSTYLPIPHFYFITRLRSPVIPKKGNRVKKKISVVKKGYPYSTNSATKSNKFIKNMAFFTLFHLKTSLARCFGIVVSVLDRINEKYTFQLGL